ncbi:MAG: phage terminase large subunit, partial [Dactylosporangium sp.]|nr:phage terminase large subunit [Dactylosporangium sp.]
LYNLLPERGYVVRVWPARYPTPDKIEKYGARLAPIISNALDRDPSLAGRPTDRFTHEDLLERELSYGRQGFALQFQLDTSLSDADRYPLKLSDLIVHPLDPFRAPADFMWASSPELALSDLPTIGLAGDRYYRPAWFTGDSIAEYEGAIMFVDPSGRGRDETAYAVVKQLHGRLFLTAAGGFRSGYDEEKTLVPLITIAKKQRVNLILVEPNYGGGMFTALLKGVSQRLYPCGVEDADWSSTQKEARIVDTLEPVLNQHRLVVCPSVIEADYRSTENYGGEDVQRCRLFYQLTRMTRERGALAYDDRVDALAGAVSYWVNVMARDTQQAAIEHKERMLEAELEKFMEHSLGAGWDQGRDRWVSQVMRKGHR